MKIGHIELRVAKPLTSLAFYRDVLGFEVEANQDDRFIWLRLGDVELLLRPGTDVVRSDAFDRASTNIVLYTDDLPGTKRTLEARGLAFRGDDQGCPLFTDPDGHWFQLVDPGH